MTEDEARQVLLVRALSSQLLGVTADDGGALHL